jgi:hypothetical protein
VALATSIAAVLLQQTKKRKRPNGRTDSVFKSG